jgi:hypothetical protein
MAELRAQISLADETAPRRPLCAFVLHSAAPYRSAQTAFCNEWDRLGTDGLPLKYLKRILHLRLRTGRRESTVYVLLREILRSTDVHQQRNAGGVKGFVGHLQTMDYALCRWEKLQQ